MLFIVFQFLENSNIQYSTPIHKSPQPSQWLYWGELYEVTKPSLFQKPEPFFHFTVHLQNKLCSIRTINLHSSLKVTTLILDHQQLKVQRQGLNNATTKRKARKKYFKTIFSQFLSNKNIFNGHNFFQSLSRCNYVSKNIISHIAQQCQEPVR